MLRHLTIAVAVVTALFLVVPTGEAAAQLRFAVAGGPSFPLGDLADGADAGWHGQVSAGLSVPFIPIALRVDGAYNRFPTPTPGNFQVLSGTVNAVFTIPSVMITPYFIGGLGFYSSRTTGAGTTAADEASNAGANIGAGVRLGLPLFSIFGEARLHNIFHDGDHLRYAPVSIGVHF
jgi:hypothetical protein